MRTCTACQIDLKGQWVVCPLCQTPLEETKKGSLQESSFLKAPLSYDRRKALQSFIRISLVLVLLFFVVQLIRPFTFFGLEYVLFGIFIIWTVIAILIQKRRNLAKAVVYLLFFISLFCLYFDYTNGWRGWSITFAIPILCIASLLAIFIGILSIDLNIRDYILYLQLVALFGIVPLLFLLMDWVGHPLPSLISVILSIVMFIGVFINYRSLVIQEFQKRMHL